MSVEFEDEVNEAHTLYGRFMPSNQLPKLVSWVMKTGVVKNENQANYFLIGLAVVAFLISFYFFGNLFVDTEVRTLSPDELLS